MRNSMIVAAIGLAGALMANPSFANNICNFSYQNKGSSTEKDWALLCNTLNNPSQLPKFVISDVTYFSDKVFEGRDWCDSDEFITYPDEKTKNRGDKPRVRPLSSDWINGKCRIPQVESGGQKPPDEGKIQQGLPGIGNSMTRGTDFSEVSDIVIYMDYYSGSESDFEIPQGNAGKTCVTARDVRPVILNLNRTKKNVGQGWNQWQLASYGYLPATTRIPGLPACIKTQAHLQSPPGWTNYDIKPNRSNTGPNRLLQVTYSYEDGSGSPISVSWQQYCKDDALYVQSARAHFLSVDNIDICNCNATNGGLCQ